MKRSKHSLSHYKLLTGKMGNLIPCGMMEVLPGDTIQQATSLLVRCAPLNAPIMHPIHVRVHHWFVPHRLVWPNFTKFITGGSDGMDSTVAPTLTVNPSVGDLAEYLGVPTGTSQVVSAVPFRAYSLIYNEFYRDEDLVTPLTVSTADGTDTTTNTTMQPVAWEKDYFTSARPWTQKGSAVTLPLGTRANVLGFAKQNTTFETSSASGTDATGATVTYPYATVISDSSGNRTLFMQGTAATGGSPNIYADLTNATAATINQLRHAFALQKYEEARALYGSRYTEYLRYLGVRSSDARLQRPEYLGGGRQTIQFSEVLQTAPTTSGTPTTGVASLLGHGIGAVRSNRYRRFFEEHGYVLSLLSVLPKTIYATGLSKTWTRASKEDYWQKELQHIGQKEIYNKEVYAAHSSPTGVFGYQDRYDEYRRQESSIAGLFRTTLNYWHDARLFAADTTLNSSFVNANPSTRIFQDTSDDNLYIMANHSVQARRLVDRMGVPGGVI